MPPVKDNTRLYPAAPFERYAGRIANEIFIVEVLSVDIERRVLTLMDIKDGLIHADVEHFPANNSSYEAVDINMPEPGAMGLACNWAYEGGYHQPIVIAWIHGQTAQGIDTIASRPISGDQIQGYSDRL